MVKKRALRRPIGPLENQEKEKKKVFLIGRGISNSLSARIHNAAFERLGVNAEYELCDLTGQSLGGFITSLRGRTDALGFNVTAPFKEEIVPFLSSVDRRAKSIGAVNTVKLSKDGTMKGYNTDYDGIVASLAKLGVRRRKRGGALILGAGGAARACVSVLLDLGYSDITILNRTLRKAEGLEREFSTRKSYQKISSGALTEENFKRQLLNGCHLAINAVSNSNSDHFPIVVDFSDAKEGCAVFDLGYKEESLFLSKARQEGLRTLDGLLMLVVQAAKSSEVWTGKKAPLKTMMQAAKDELRNHRERKNLRGPLPQETKAHNQYQPVGRRGAMN